MSFLGEGRASNSSKFFSAACASMAVAALAGSVEEAQAVVFEQKCNGQIIAMGSGASRGAPLQGDANFAGDPKSTPTSIVEISPSLVTADKDVPAGVAMAAETPPPTSLCANPPAGTPGKGVRTLEAINAKLSLPKPRNLSQKLSERQEEMRDLAKDVALRFADNAAVLNANLDSPAFVKLFTTMVHRESNFRPRAVSPVGARGLGQLMPMTARYLGVKDSFAPEENLVGAATYLTEMLDQFGSAELALAAYNAGPTAVSKYGGIPPFRETRQYVADIFHEVLREPLPSHESAELTEVARRGLAAFQSVNVPVTQTNPFDAVLNEEGEKDGEGTHLLSLVSHVAQDNTVVPQPKERNEPNDEAGKIEEPDLTDLPKPREFGAGLSKSQLAMRDLTVGVALKYADAPGVGKAGLTQKEFANLFTALIRRQSSFDRRALSSDGAKGLGQLMPATVKEFGVKDPFSAEDNLEVAAKRFTSLLDQYGSPVLALAAYNTGSSKLKDTNVIPESRHTPQLIANVLHDVTANPAPVFLAERFAKTPPPPVQTVLARKSPSADTPDNVLEEVSDPMVAQNASGQKYVASMVPISTKSLIPGLFEGIFAAATLIFSLLLVLRARATALIFNCRN